MYTHSPESPKPSRLYGDEFAFTAMNLDRPLGPDTKVQTIMRQIITRDNYDRCLEDTLRTLQIIVDPRTDKTFEIAVSNCDAPGGSYDAEISTYNSAISTNAGNAVEFSEHAALYPLKRRLYVASFGNGFSSPLQPKEREYLKKTGSLLYCDEPLPTVRALQRALKRADIYVERLSANAAGGNVATALMTDLAEGQVTHAFIKNRPNVVSHNSLLLAYRMLVAENIFANSSYRANSRDPWALTDEIIDQVKEQVQEKVVELDGPAQKIGRVAAVSKLFRDGVAYSKGGSSPSDSPAARDTRMAIEKQPIVKMTYHFSENDRLYRSRYTDLVEFIGSISAKAEPGYIQGLLVPGAHSDHTYVPSVRWSTEAYAFGRRA